MNTNVPMPCVRLGAEQLQLAGRLIFRGPALGLTQRDADLVADHLSDADRCGYPSHGLQRTMRYRDAVVSGALLPNRPPTVAHVFGCNARIEGARTLGRLAMEEVVQQALRLGLAHGAANVLTLTHHIGRMAPYLRRVAEAGYLVQCQVNAVGSPTTSILTKKPRLGTNPIGFGVPCAGRAPLVLDFTPASTTEGNMRVLHAAKVAAPAGLLLDATGKPTTNPGVIYETAVERLGSILPFGGQRMPPMAHLLTMIECGPGALTGNLSATIGSAPRKVRGMNAVLFSIVHPERAFGLSLEDYAARVAETAAYLKQGDALDPLYADDDGSVLLPGDYEAKMLRRSDAEGVILSEATWCELQEAATSVGASIAEIHPSEKLMA